MSSLPAAISALVEGKNVSSNPDSLVKSDDPNHVSYIMTLGSVCWNPRARTASESDT